MEIKEYGRISKKKKKTTDNQRYLSTWDWIAIILLLLGLICGSVLIYQWWDRKQKLERLQAQIQQLEQEAQKQYQLQELNLISTNDLVNSPTIHSLVLIKW